jgi:hypothetical protein
MTKKKTKHTHEAAQVTELCACGAVRHNQGPWILPGDKSHGPDPLAQALTARYLVRTTPEERSQNAKLAAASRWAGKEKERKKFLTTIARRPRPSRVIQDRCPCGRYSRWLAAKRGHRCETAQ